MFFCFQHYSNKRRRLAISASNRSFLGALLNRLSLFQSHYRCYIYRQSGIEIGGLCIVEAGVKTSLGIAKGVKGKISLGSRAQLCQGVILDSWGGDITILDNVFIGPYTVIYGHGGVKVGQNSLISMHCRILSSNHTIPEQNISIRSQPDILLPTAIGEDVWLGAGVTVLGGVRIGDGCVVGAGAVVAKDLPPYSIAMGVPAKVVRMRECNP
jgi:acetyltransferase-like isoleucine patch superfamily enzyme